MSASLVSRNQLYSLWKRKIKISRRITPLQPSKIRRHNFSRRISPSWNQALSNYSKYLIDTIELQCDSNSALFFPMHWKNITIWEINNGKSSVYMVNLQKPFKNPLMEFFVYPRAQKLLILEINSSVLECNFVTLPSFPYEIVSEIFESETEVPLKKKSFSTITRVSHTNVPI